MIRVVGTGLVVGAVLGGVGEVREIEFPTVRWPFAMSRTFSWLRFPEKLNEFSWLSWAHLPDGVNKFPWFGWFLTVFAGLLGILILIKFSKAHPFTPIMERRIQRFRSIKRGYYSLMIILALAFVGALDHLLVGSEALVVKYDGKTYYPAFTRTIEKGSQFGQEGDAGEAPADYRHLKAQFKKAGDGNKVYLPFVPYAPTGDTIAAVSTPLSVKDGLVVKRGDPFQGLGSRVYDVDELERIHMRYTYRRGVRHGRADGWDREGNPVYGAEYRGGELVPDSERWNGTGALADFLAINSSALRQVHFPPAPPVLGTSPRHVLGTTSQGYDVVAFLFGGLQVNFKAALIYIPIVYVIGITVGLLMGFFGGMFDLVVQRVIEIFSNIPFLFVVMIASAAIPGALRDRAGLGVILLILVCFGWMGMTYLMRTSALKEKSRDYIAATRVLGASTARIMYRHLLPNSVAILVTLIPFSVSGLILALTSLDYLGFGLPDKYASWGKLLKNGLENLSSPWLVSAAFLALVAMLILVTFVGEAVREAFDPKKFTYYR